MAQPDIIDPLGLYELHRVLAAVAKATPGEGEQP
jgi:hypothetical protein